jgi:hypothetical protein
MHVAEVTRLFEATGAEWAEPPRAAFPRRGPVNRAQAANSAAVKSRAKPKPKPKLE